MVDFAELNRRTSRDRAVAKIVAMIPRLASEHDGEVVATVRAIQRVLEGAEMDWHELVKRIVLEESVGVMGKAYEPAPPRPASPTYDGFRPTPRRHDSDAWMANEIESTPSMFAQCSAWEQQFITSVRAQLASGRLMSDKQRETLRRVYKKCNKSTEDILSDWGDADGE